jgi:hypothetical protein
VDPANLGRIRRYCKTRIEQALIEAIAGPEQHLMQARPYRLLVPIRCRVVNVEDSHSAAEYWAVYLPSFLAPSGAFAKEPRIGHRLLLSS